MVAYAVSKTEAEKAVWEFGQRHPELDITTSVSHPLHVV